MKKKMLAATLLMGLLAACGGNSASIVGSWVEPVPGLEGQVQGIKMEEGGVASSVNMATLVYVWGIERSGFFNDRGKWVKGFENQRV